MSDTDEAVEERFSYKPDNPNTQCYASGCLQMSKVRLPPKALGQPDHQGPTSLCRMHALHQLSGWLKMLEARQRTLEDQLEAVHAAIDCSGMTKLYEAMQELEEAD